MPDDASVKGSVNDPGRRSGRGCPICGKPAERATRPFCSKHCADVDLGRWLGGGYAIPGEPAPESAELPEGDERD